MPPRFGILTISDRSSRHEREDMSGPALAARIRDLGWEVGSMGMVPDEMDEIRKVLVEWSDAGNIDVILTTGGTGFAARDVTPEATLGVLDRLAPGISEAIRAESLKITPHAMLSRAVSGIRKRTLIVNFPGSPRAVLENLALIQAVLPHAVELLQESPDSEKSHSIIK
jgi:molybdopterin adenylyltransferase